MSYESRQPTNYSFGALTQTATLQDTTLTSDDFRTRLPSGLSTILYVPITLQDPSTAAYEIVWATSHTAGSATATVLRGRENTTTTLWPAGTLWTISPTLRDGILPVPNRAALPTDAHVGLRAYLQDEQVTIEKFLPCWGPPEAMLRQTTAQSIPHSGPFNPILFQAEEFDNANGHDPVTNPSRYTVKLAGRYECLGSVGFVVNATGFRATGWFKNGVAPNGGVASTPAFTLGDMVAYARPIRITCAVGDYIELQAYQESGGGALSTAVTGGTQSTMLIRYIGT